MILGKDFMGKLFSVVFGEQPSSDNNASATVNIFPYVGVPARDVGKGLLCGLASRSLLLCNMSHFARNIGMRATLIPSGKAPWVETEMIAPGTLLHHKLIRLSLQNKPKNH